MYLRLKLQRKALWKGLRLRFNQTDDKAVYQKVSIVFFLDWEDGNTVHSLSDSAVVDISIDGVCTRSKNVEFSKNTP